MMICSRSTFRGYCRCSLRHNSGVNITDENIFGIGVAAARDLLEQLHIEFEVVTSTYEEHNEEFESPYELVEAQALGKPWRRWFRRPGAIKLMWLLVPIRLWLIRAMCWANRLMKKRPFRCSVNCLVIHTKW